jgi:hypothetical protein
MLAQEVIRKLLNSYERHWKFMAFFDGNVIHIRGMIDERFERGTVREIEERVMNRITKDLKELFHTPKRIDAKVWVYDSLSKVSVGLTRKNLKDEFFMSGRPPRPKYQAIWNEIINASASLKYTLNPKLTSLTSANGKLRGFAKTIATPIVKEDGFVYRYYCTVELKTPASDKEGASLELHLLTYAECRAGADSTWNVVRIADSIDVFFDKTTEVFSITPLYKRIMERITK